jgi:hypothetical protein
VSIRAQIKPLIGLTLFLALATSIGVAATKDTQAPDREMLKMMEFLREMEMIKQMEMLQNMEQLENTGETKTAAPQKTPPTKRRRP